MDPPPPPPRLARITLTAAILVFMLSMFFLVAGGEAARWQASLRIWYTEYDGCMCSDCVPGYTLLERQIYVPLLGYGHTVVLGAITLMYSIGLFIAACAFTSPFFDKRARDPSRCPACRYSRVGLPITAPCPECGAPPFDPLA